MAVRAKTITKLGGFRNLVWVVEWLGLTKTTDDTGDPMELPSAADRSVQVVGTFGTGGNLRVQGSNDGTTWAVLTDPQGNALNFTAAGIEAVTELTRHIRPAITAGDVATDIQVYLLLRRVYP